MKKGKFDSFFWKLIFKYRYFFGGAVLFRMLSLICTLTLPIVIKNLIDSILAEKTVESSGVISQLIVLSGGRSYVAQNLWIAALASVALTILFAIFLHFMLRIILTACELIVKDIRDQLYVKFQNLPEAAMAESETGDLIQRCTSDVSTVHIFLSGHLLELTRIVMILVITVPMMFVVDLKMAYLSLMLVPIIGAVVFHYFRVLIRQSIDFEEKEANLTTVIQENLMGIRVVRAFARQALEREKFNVKNQAYYRSVVRRMDTFATFFAISSQLAFVQLGLVMFGGAWMVIIDRVTLGTLVAFFTYSSFMVFNFRALGIVLAEVGGSIVAISRINKVLDMAGQQSTTESVEDLNLAGEIQFKNVSFAYSENNKVLNNISFHIKSGETVAIVGPSGSGKSTLIELLLRNYDCQTGSILLDDLELNTLDPRSVRSQIGTSLQEVFLFLNTIRTNIKISRDAATDDEMIDASKTASIHETIQNFPKNYDTNIGEQGVSLSGGQRQRVVLARTFVKRPPILILDDSLSAVDISTENDIMQALNDRHGQVTVIVITHRLSCCINADRILVMENGKLTHQGPHQSLVQQDGFYQRLWQIQQGIAQESGVESEGRLKK